MNNNYCIAIPLSMLVFFAMCSYEAFEGNILTPFKTIGKYLLNKMRIYLSKKRIKKEIEL